VGFWGSRDYDQDTGFQEFLTDSLFTAVVAAGNQK